jgi:hypothetical protein
MFVIGDIHGPSSLPYVKPSPKIFAASALPKVLGNGFRNTSRPSGFVTAQLDERRKRFLAIQMGAFSRQKNRA